MTDDPARELLAAMRELTTAITGLTGVLMEQEQGEVEDTDEPVVPLAYMDGSPRA